MSQHRKLAFLLTLSGLAAAGSTLAASGTVTFVTGDVRVQRKDGTRVAAAKGTVINAGDTVVTREKGMAQVAMVDQAKLSLRPNTQVQVEQYADRPDSDQGASLNLLRGTMRTSGAATDFRPLTDCCTCRSGTSAGGCTGMASRSSCMPISTWLALT